MDEIVNKPQKLHHISVWNLPHAFDVINKWESDLSELNEENTEFVQFQQNEIEKIGRNPLYTMCFHERFLTTVCESKVFMYPQLLPAGPFRPEKKSFEYIPAED